MAYRSLFHRSGDFTTVRTKPARICSYVVTLPPGTSEAEVASLAPYLSTLGTAGCEVVVLDDSGRYDEHRQILRWVARHEDARELDRDRAPSALASEVAGCEKVIVAEPEARYDAAAIERMCALLERHDAVEPEEYVERPRWWSLLDGGETLLHRGVDQTNGTRASRGQRRFAICEARRVPDFFVRREPLPLARWIRARRHSESNDFFLGLAPLFVILALIGGSELAAGYAGIIAFVSVMIAFRGRVGAARYYPLRACLFAPLWIAERAFAGYWSLADRLRQRVVAATPRIPEPGPVARFTARSRG